MTPRAQRFTLTWDQLCSVNERLVPAPGKKKRLTISPKWRDRMATCHWHCMKQRGRGVRPESLTLWAVHMHLWVPDDTREHDAPNYIKLPLDALEDVIYLSDHQVKKVTMEHMGSCREPHLFMRAVPLKR